MSKNAEVLELCVWEQEKKRENLFSERGRVHNFTFYGEDILGRK